MSSAPRVTRRAPCASEYLRAALVEVDALEGRQRSSRLLLGGRSAPTREEYENLCALNGAWVVSLGEDVVLVPTWETWETVAQRASKSPDARWWAIVPGVGVVDPRPEPRLSEKGRATLDRLRPRRTSASCLAPRAEIGRDE